MWHILYIRIYAAMLIKDRLLKLINKKETHHESKTLASVGGGVEHLSDKAFGCFIVVEKFSSLEVEKEELQHLFPRPLRIQLRKDDSRPMCHVILSPTSIQGRRIFKTLQKGDSSGFRPQNDGTLASLVSPRPLWERVEFQVERERNLEIRVRGVILERVIVR